MVNSAHDDDALKDGAEIIRRFGGIRPMAGKLDIPVTTVQGWKNRDTIPSQRRDFIIEMAREHDVDLSDLIPELTAEQDNTSPQDTDLSKNTPTDIIEHDIAKQDNAQPDLKTAPETDPQIVAHNGLSSEKLHDHLVPKNMATNDITADLPPISTPQGQETPEITSQIPAQQEPSLQEPLPQEPASQGPASQGPAPQGPASQGYVTMAELEKRLQQLQHHNNIRIYWGSAIVACVIIALGIALFWPDYQNVQQTISQNNQRLVLLENDVSNIDQDVQEIQGKRGSFFGGLIPESMKERLNDLNENANQISGQIGDLAQQTKDIAGQVTQDVTQSIAQGNLTKNLTSAQGVQHIGQQVQTHLQNLNNLIAEFDLSATSLNDYQTLFERIAQLQLAENGASQLADITAQLQAAMTPGLADNDNAADSTDSSTPSLMDTLSSIRGDDSALGQSLQGIDNQNLQAAAMLLVFTQMRQSLGRDNQSFDDDLGLLRGMLDTDKNASLIASIDALAPKAERGILTPGGLSRELRSLSGDIVNASLRGEDISIGEKASARLNNVLSIEKDGDLLSGNNTQKHLAKAQEFLDKNQIEEAIAELQAIQGGSENPAAASASNPDIVALLSPLMAQAQTTLQAQQLQSLLGQDIITRLIPNGQATTTPLAPNTNTLNEANIQAPQALFQQLRDELFSLTSPQISRDPASGFAILPKPIALPQ